MISKTKWVYMYAFITFKLDSNAHLANNWRIKGYGVPLNLFQSYTMSRPTNNMMSTTDMKSADL